MIRPLAVNGVFLANRDRLDLESMFTLLVARVRASTEKDWSALAKIMSIVLSAKDQVLALSTRDSQNVCWRTRTAFGARLGVKVALVEHLAGASEL